MDQQQRPAMTQAERRDADDKREWEEQQRRRGEEQGRRVRGARLARVNGRLAADEPYLAEFEKEEADTRGHVGDLRGRLSDLRLSRDERRGIERSLEDATERLRQITDGWSPMAEGDLFERMARRGVKLDGRSLPFLRRQVAELRAERDNLVAQGV